MPEPLRDGIHNAITNLNSPVVLAPMIGMALTLCALKVPRLLTTSLMLIGVGAGGRPVQPHHSAHSVLPARCRQIGGVIRLITRPQPPHAASC